LAQSGSQYPLKSPNEADCSGMCDKHPGCTAWTMKPGGVGALCIVFDDYNKKKLQANEFAITGILKK
jgi:hypothetical protein